MQRRLRIVVGLFLVSTWCVLAQSFNPSNLTIDSGLSSNYVRSIFKDSKGLMWFGTDTGLDSFDGVHTINYAKRFKTPLKGAVQSIAELQEDVLLIGTSWGAYLYDIHQNKLSPVDFGIPSIDVRMVFTSSKGRLYVATDRGLFLFDRTTLQTKLITVKGGLNVSFTSIVEDAHGAIWVAGFEGLYKLESTSELVLVLQVQNIRVVRSTDNTLYIGTLHGLLQYNIQNHQAQSLKRLEGISILSLETDQAGDLIIGTDNAGVFQLNTKNTRVTAFDHATSFVPTTISALFFDTSKTLWIGTFNGGVYFQNLQKGKKFLNVAFENSMNANIRSVYITPLGEKYIGTRNGSLICLDSMNKLISKVGNHQNQRFRSDILTTIFPFPNKPDLVLVGTFGGGVTIYNKKNQKCSDFSVEKTFQSGTIYKFCSDKQGHLWIATLNGLYRYTLSDKSLVRYNSSPITGSNEVFAVHSDGKDKIWLGTKTGVCFYSLSSQKFVQPESCKPYRFQCTATFVDSKGNSWFCFNKGGVLQLDPNLKEKLWLTKEIGLPQNAPSSLLEDPSGNIWIGTSKGLFQVNQKHEVQAYGLEDGLTGIGFCPESATLDQSGKMWWSNDRGLVSFLNDKSILNKRVPPIKWADLIINGHRYDVDTLDFVSKTGPDHYAVHIQGKTNNNLEFRVAALNYLQAGRNQYSYFMEGLDKQWSRASTNSLFSFNQLPPGNYTLKIKASNNDGLWTPVPVEIMVSITPYFYESVWFLVLIWLMVGGLILFFTRTYIRRVRLKIRTQLEDMKTRKASGATMLKINEQKSNTIKEHLLAYMQQEKPWLNSELRQADVANALGYSIHELSQVLNVQLNHNFSDFINSFRVEEVKRRIQCGDTQKYTLTAIAIQSGFSAKSSFQRVFKKATTMTPTEYLKNQGKNSTSDTNKPS